MIDHDISRLAVIACAVTLARHFSCRIFDLLIFGLSAQHKNILHRSSSRQTSYFLLVRIFHYVRRTLIPTENIFQKKNNIYQKHLNSTIR